jgi:hypothetical protein
MFRMLRILLVSVLVLASSPAHAGDSSSPDPSSGNGLLAQCDTTASYEDRAYCLGYLRGVRDMNKLYRDAGAPSFFCEPPDGTNGQLRQVVLKFLKEYPQLLHYPGLPLAVEALRNAFPCPR